MSSQARVPTVCATCQQNRFLDVRQEVTNAGELRWFEVFACPCGHGFETGGQGIPTPAIREAILKQCGRAEVWIDSASSVQPAITLLVGAFGVTDAEAKQKFTSLPALVFEGTHPEARFVNFAFGKGGAVGRIVTFPP